MKNRVSVLSGSVLVAVLAALLAVGPACAEPGDGRPDVGWGGPGRGPGADGDNFRQDRQERMRERRRDSSFGRMSPEERRQLRHDIRAAREGVYRRSPPPPQAPFPADPGRP